MNQLHLGVARVLCAFGLVGIAAETAAANYDRMVVFGDSLSDTGNLSLTLGPGVFPALNYDPLRVTSGPTTVPAGSTSGVMVEHLNSLLGLPDLLPAVQGGTNYAWAYANTGLDPIDIPNLQTPGTGAQVASFLTSNPVASPDSLYVMWSGANDLFEAPTPESLQATVDAAIANIKAEISALVSAGARNVLWLNLPDLGLTPDAASGGPLAMALMHAASLEFRNQWSTGIEELKWLYPEVQFTGVDVFGFMHTLFADPAAYGFTNVVDSAQGQLGANPDEYLFWDGVHPTAYAHSLVAEYAFQQLQPVPEVNGSVYLSFALFGLIAQRVYAGRKARARKVA